MFDNTNFDFFSSDIWVFNKTNLYTGGAAAHRHFRYAVEGLGPLNAMVPAVTYDNAMETNFMVATWLGDYVDPVAGPIGLLRVYSIGGPVNAPVFNDYAPSGLFVYGSASLYNPPWGDYSLNDGNSAPQLGTTSKIYLGDSRIQNVVFRYSTLWCAHHVFLPYNSPSRSAVQWFACTPGGTVLQRGRVDHSGGAKHYGYPSIAVNQYEDVLLGYTRFGADQYPSVNYSFHSYEDFPGTLRADTVLKAGEGPFRVDDDGLTRWGDWSATVVDPNDIDLWTLQEYGAPISGGGDRWGTWWGLVSPPTSMALTMTANTNRVLATANATYSLRATNLLGQPVTGVRLTDTLPPGAVFVSAVASQGTCSHVAGVVTCDVGTLPAQGSVTATIVARLNASGTATNRATLTAYGPDIAPGDNTVSVLISVDPSSDLSVTVVDSPDPVPLNTTLTYQAGVSNAGPSAAPSVFLTNTIPAGVTYVSATAAQGSCSRNGNIVTCSLGTILPGASIPVTIRVTPTVSANLVNAAVVTSTSALDIAPANNSTSITTRANASPTLSALSNRSILEDASTGSFPITVGDAETPAASLTLAGFSSAPAIVPPGGFVFGGSANARTATVTPLPDASGVVTVFIYVTDGDGGRTTNSFVLTVSPVNDLPTVNDVPNQRIGEDSTLGPITVTVSDSETPAASLGVTATSSNPTLVPSGNILVGGAGNSRTLTLTPAANLFGSATITIFVSDGVATSSDSFILTVDSVNNVPTITAIGPRIINEDDPSSGAISFMVGDLETVPGSLTLTGFSSNPSLVPTNGITFGGAGANRTVSVTPAPDQFGDAIVTVAVSDGAGSTNTTFLLTVRDVNDPPTLARPADLLINEDSGTSAVTVTLISGGPTNESRTVSLVATSSIPAVVPHPAINYTSPSATASLQIAPSLNATGVVRITLIANDGGASNNITMQFFDVTVLPINDPPTVSPVSNQSIDEDGSTGPLAVTIGDIDSPVGSLTLSAFSTNATLVLPGGFSFAGINADRSLEIRPATNQFGQTLIQLVVSDGQASTTNSFRLDVAPGNDPPEITSATVVTTPEDFATNVVVSVSDGETAPAALIVTATSSNPGLFPNVSNAVSGTDGTRTIGLAPASNASGVAVVTVVVRDAQGQSATNFITVTVQPENDPPTVAIIQGWTVEEDSGAQSVPLTGIGAGAPDEFQTLVVSATSDNPSVIPHPTVSYLSPNTSALLTFAPAANASGSANITVTINDGQPANNQFTRNFTVNVTPVNDAPSITVTGVVDLLEDGTTNLVVTFADPDTDAAELEVQVGTSNEELIDPNGLTLSGVGFTRTLTLAPMANQFGSATLTLVVSDNQGGTDLALINLSVVEVNDLPQISTIDELVIQYDSSSAPIPFSVSDEETFADALQVTARSADTELVPPAGIVLGGSGFGRTIQVTPAPGKLGSTTITIQVIDESSGTNSMTFTVRVQGSTAPPTITAIPNQETVENRATSPAAFTIADADTALGDLEIAASSSNTGLVANSEIVLGGSGANRTVYVRPATNRVGVTMIRVAVTDRDGLSDSRTFQVTVRPVDYPPSISAIGNVSLAEDGSSVVNFVVGDDDSGPELLAITASSSNPSVLPPSGLVLGGGAGASRTLTLQPAANQSGTSVVAITVIDINGMSTNRSFVATVTPVNDVPTVSGLTAVSVEEDTPSGALTFVVADAETDAAALEVSAVSQNPTIVPNSGLTLGGSGAQRTIVIRPATNQFGTVTVVVMVSDGADSVTSNLVVKIASVNDTPTLDAPGNLILSEDAGLQTVNLLGIGAGAGEAQTLVVSASSSNTGLIPAPAVTYASPAATGTLRFTPVPNATGVATISVTVSDGQSVNGSITRTFTVTVNSTGDAPTISAVANQQTIEDLPLTIPFVIQDPDTPLVSLAITATSTNPALVALTNIVINGSGTNRSVTITPSPNLFGTSLISLRVSDGTTVASNLFVLNVVPSNDPPTLNPILHFSTNAANGNPSHTILLTGISSGATNESQTLSVTATSSNPGFLPNPTVTYTSPNSDGSLTLRPGNSMTGNAVITVTVSDNAGATTVRAFALNVKATANGRPAISLIANQTINEDVSSGQIEFTVSDPETPLGSLSVYASSANTALIPDARIVLGGSGGNRTVTVRPATNAFGTAMILLTVVDGASGASNMTFNVTVNPVNDPPTISPIASQTMPEDGTLTIPFTVADVEARAADLVVTATSLETTLFPQANVQVSGSGTDRSVTVSPAANLTGNGSIRLVVSDGVATSTNVVALSVTPTNDVPTISDIPDQITSEDVPLTGIAVNVGDAETSLGTLVLSAVSSNPSLISPTSIVFGGNGGARTMGLTPTPNQFGTAVITITVDDLAATASDTFVLTVSPLNDPPSLALISDQVVRPGGLAATVPLTGIAFGPTNENQAILLTATSSNPSIVPHPVVNYSSPAETGSLTISAPAGATGSAVISVTANDGQAQNNTVTVTFNVTLNEAPTIGAVASQLLTEDAVAPIVVPFTVGDAETAADMLQVSVAAANGDIFSASGMVLGGAGANRQLSLTPTPDAFGSTTVTLTVEDAAGNRTDRVVPVTVRSVNDRPTLAALSDLELSTASESAVVSLSGIGSGAANENQFLLVQATSSNPSIVPHPLVTYTSPSDAGAIRLTPTGLASGPVVITVSVEDDTFDEGGGSNRVSRTFTVNVTGGVAPVLAIAWVGGKAVVSWPTNNSAGFVLQTTTGIGSGSWSLVPVMPAVVNGRYTVTNEPSSGGPIRFYRLCSGCPGPPALSVRLEGAEVVVTWPAAGSGGYVLQSSGTLPAAGAWANVPGTPPLAGANYVARFPASTGPKFFRLCLGCGN